MMNPPGNQFQPPQNITGEADTLGAPAGVIQGVLSFFPLPPAYFTTTGSHSPHFSPSSHHLGDLAP